MLPAFLTADYEYYFDGVAIDETFGPVNAINEVGTSAYHAALTISLFICVIALALIFICRFIFRVASAREDAHAKQYIQRTLIVIVMLSFITTIFSAVMSIASGL